MSKTMPARHGQWSIVRPLAQAKVLGGPYLKSADGSTLIFARRYRLGDRGERSYRIEYSTVRYASGDAKTGGANETLYSGQSLAKAKAALQ